MCRRSGSTRAVSRHWAGALRIGKASWSTAASATLHCLTGCAIGEVIGTWLGLSNFATIVLAVALAFALAVAVVLTVPVNKSMIGRGRGHAVVHQYH